MDPTVPTQSRRPWLLVISLCVLIPAPVVVYALTKGRCEQDVARMLERKMRSGELAMPRSDSPEVAARRMAGEALENIVVPTRDVVAAFGASALLLACAAGVIRTRERPRGRMPID